MTLAPRTCDSGTFPSNIDSFFQIPWDRVCLTLPPRRQTWPLALQASSSKERANGRRFPHPKGRLNRIPQPCLKEQSNWAFPIPSSCSLKKKKKTWPVLRFHNPAVAKNRSRASLLWDSDLKKRKKKNHFTFQNKRTNPLQTGDVLSPHQMMTRQLQNRPPSSPAGV